MHHKDGVLEGSEGIFTTGMSEYSDGYPGLVEPLPRIYVKFQPDGIQTTHLALLDTGLGEVRLLTAKGRIRGDLFKHDIELIADEGENLVIEATVFISSDWKGTSVLGYTGAIERAQTGLGPLGNGFYFGPLGGA